MVSDVLESGQAFTLLKVELAERLPASLLQLGVISGCGMGSVSGGGSSEREKAISRECTGQCMGCWDRSAGSHRVMTGLTAEDCRCCGCILMSYRCRGIDQTGTGTVMATGWIVCCLV